METRTKSVSPELSDLLAQGNSLIEQAQAFFIQRDGKSYDFSEWVTIKEYTMRYGINSTNVVSNWIRRGIIPAENVVDFPELNNLRLIKAVPYHEE